MEWQAPQPTLAAAEYRGATARRPGATSSCAECRRRRIRCDGLFAPCRQCVYYQVPHLCHYPLRKPRRSVSWRSYTELYEAHAKCQKVLGALFPSASIDDLSAMSREQLVEKAQVSLHLATPPATDAGSLDHIRSLELSPECNFTWDEVSGADDESQASRVADDVNGLALSLEPLNASYLGFTSVPTMLRVIAHVSPRVQQVLPMSPTTWRSSEWRAGSHESSSSSKVDELSLINAYFSHIHLITPMVDEMDFRQRYAEVGLSESQDSSWLALANMILAMGCFASETTRFTSNNVFYKRALSHLNISSFGSGHLYTVQALALYGGYLLHYLNKPNMASAVIGATIRMAVAMGLHRVQVPKTDAPGPQRATENSIITRIRTWWSIFCFDTWGAATLGRPGTGYWDPATVLTSPTSSVASLDYGTISLAASEQFCKIATRCEERLVQRPLISPEGLVELDKELLAWQQSLPLVLVSREQCPPTLRVARGLLWCRFMTTRLTLYRPCLLSAALGRRRWSDIKELERNLILKCIEIARDGIDIITLDWIPNQVISWNSTWHLFQIALVLILALVSDRESAEEERCSEYVNKALIMFAQMEPWTAGATRSRQVIQVLFNAVGDHDGVEGGDSFSAMDALGPDVLDTDLVWDDEDWLALFDSSN